MHTFGIVLPKVIFVQRIEFSVSQDKSTVISLEHELTMAPLLIVDSAVYRIPAPTTIRTQTMSSIDSDEYLANGGYLQKGSKRNLREENLGKDIQDLLPSRYADSHTILKTVLR